MNDPTEPEQGAADPSAPVDSLDAGLAAGFGRPVDDATADYQAITERPERRSAPTS